MNTLKCNAAKSCGAAILLLLLCAQAASSLTISDRIYTRAFSPNGDGEQDECPISFQVDGDSVIVDGAGLFFALAAEVPPPGETVVNEIVPSCNGDTLITCETVWDGSDSLGLVLADGFYYLHILAWAGGDSLWTETPVELEINTVGPDLISVAVEPGPYFAPLAGGGDSLRVYFTSAAFDPLTDAALLDVLLQDEETGDYAASATVERDLAYAIDLGGSTRYRFVWRGEDESGAVSDGLYRGDLLLSDEAGNSPASTSVYFNLDAEAPILEALVFGDSVPGQIDFEFHPDSLPDTLVIRSMDRNGTVACRADFTGGNSFDSEGLSWPDGEQSHDAFYFILPAEWTADSSHTIRLDAEDAAGNLVSELGTVLQLTVTVDSGAPDPPTWLHSSPLSVIQSAFLLEGLCTEPSISVHLFVDGASEPDTTVSVAADSTFIAPVMLDSGTHSWTAVSEDASGNLSAESAALVISYSPGVAISIPGRFRGLAGEEIQVNGFSDAEEVTIRVYTLDGELMRVIEAQDRGGGEFSASWDLLDGDGRQLLDGLYVMTISTRSSSGSEQHERKVVAIVRN